MSSTSQRMSYVTPKALALTLCSLAILSALTVSGFADGSGSGFIVRKEGCVATNHHVIDNAKEIWIKVPGKTVDFRANVAIDDSVHDLALLRIEDNSNTVFDALQISGSEPHVMDDIFVFGYPFGDLLGEEMSASRGQINAIRGRFLQIDASVNPGNSGGPVLNDRGEVVGVVRARLNASYALEVSGQLPERVNQAIDGAQLRESLNLAPSEVTPAQPLSHQEIAEIAGKATVFIKVISSQQAAAQATPAPTSIAPPVPAPQTRINQATRAMPNPETVSRGMLTRLTIVIGLTAAQQVKAKPIIDKYVADNFAIRNNATLEIAAKKAKHDQLKQQYDVDITTLLTPTQRRRYAEAR